MAVFATVSSADLNKPAHASALQIFSYAMFTRRIKTDECEEALSNEVESYVADQESPANRWKLTWFGHVVPHHSLCKTNILRRAQETYGN